MQWTAWLTLLLGDNRKSLSTTIIATTYESRFFSFCLDSMRLNRYWILLNLQKQVCWGFYCTSTWERKEKVMTFKSGFIEKKFVFSKLWEDSLLYTLKWRDVKDRNFGLSFPLFWEFTALFNTVSWFLADSDGENTGFFWTIWMTFNSSWPDVRFYTYFNFLFFLFAIIVCLYLRA
jgi:hypothetical protein